jgi:hypothetical protein
LCIYVSSNPQIGSWKHGKYMKIWGAVQLQSTRSCKNLLGVSPWWIHRLGEFCLKRGDSANRPTGELPNDFAASCSALASGCWLFWLFLVVFPCFLNPSCGESWSPEDLMCASVDRRLGAKSRDHQWSLGADFSRDDGDPIKKWLAER